MFDFVMLGMDDSSELCVKLEVILNEDLFGIIIDLFSFLRLLYVVSSRVNNNVACTSMGVSCFINFLNVYIFFFLMKIWYLWLVNKLLKLFSLVWGIDFVFFMVSKVARLFKNFYLVEIF